MRDTTSKIQSVSNESINLTEEAKEMTLENSFIKVVFKSEFFYKKYKSELEQFLKKIYEKETGVSYNHNSEQSFNNAKEDIELNKDGGIPIYSSNYEDVLQQPEPEIPDDLEENVKKLQSMTCFNCLGDHHLKDCTEPLDRQKIAANRNNLTVGNTSRYHVEERKNAVEPGFPSAELRKALGLRSDQLPRYIYYMRVIGYPPGWMQEAVFESSGLSLYDDSNGNSLSVPDSLTEENDPVVRYDSEKFVKYPGFNSPVPEGFKDEWQTLGFLPMQQHQQLSEALKSGNTMSSKNMYKRKQLPPTGSGDAKKSKSGINESEEEPKPHWSPEQSSTPKQIKRDPQLDRDNFESPILQKNLSSSLSQSPGTPIPNQNNPFFRLPSSDKFSQDITEHLPFENLPDAVGKYENMRNVLCNVQKKLQDLNKS